MPHILYVYLLQKMSDVANIDQMQPFGGQGANQALEDAGALGYIFNNIHIDEGLTISLDMFDKVRRLRASRAQVLSRVRTGKEEGVREELLRYADPPGSCE